MCRGVVLVVRGACGKTRLDGAVARGLPVLCLSEVVGVVGSVVSGVGGAGTYVRGWDVSVGDAPQRRRRGSASADQSVCSPWAASHSIRLAMPSTCPPPPTHADHSFCVARL
ncbi:MAG: hypothetical protein QOK49_666 [Baekduia sp.]|nr:hypothetical protein [Baekduia sp.]